MENQDNKYVKRCLELAAQGGRGVLPNPMVGCVIVSNGEIIAEGFHERYGETHAEVNAINSVSEIPDDSTLYVNLEPCSHTGKTPPCADLIIEKGIKNVVIGASDINPKVDGGGIKKLKEAGVSIKYGVLSDECLKLNKRFYINHGYKRPYVILKWAQTSDGFIAREDGTSKWISSEESRTLVHKWRSEEASIMVGTKTAKIDNPSLTVRHVEGINPIRIVLDRGLKLSDDLNLFDGEVRTLVFNEKQDLEKENTELIKVDFGKGLIPELLSSLWQKGIASVFVEGGAKTLQSFIDSGFWDEISKFTGTLEFGSGISAPELDNSPINEEKISTDILEHYRNQWLIKLSDRLLY